MSERDAPELSRQLLAFLDDRENVLLDLLGLGGLLGAGGAADQIVHDVHQLGRRQ